VGTMSLGMHVSKKGRGSKSRKMDAAISEDLQFMDSFGIVDPSVQIFVSGPKTFKETLSTEEKTGIRNYVTANGTSLVIHGAYVDRPWGNIPAAVHNVKNELRIGAEIGATGVIVHLSAGCADDVEFKRALVEISNIELPRPQILWLEIHAAKPCNFTYETPQKLIRLFERIRGYNITGPNGQASPIKIGLCIDTAHLFSCGTSLETHDAARTFIEGLEPIIGNGTPVMMHLNDSASSQGSGVDKHQVLCKGMIWKSYHPTTGHIPFEKSGLNYLLEWADSNRIACILERDDDELHKDLKLIHELGFYIK
jgi:endonuclease IV